MRTVFEHQVSLRWRDVDALGHVNHAVSLTYLEEGRDAFYVQTFGRDPHYLVAPVEIDLRAELRYADRQLRVRIAVERVGTTSLTTRDTPGTRWLGDPAGPDEHAAIQPGYADSLTGALARRGHMTTTAGPVQPQQDDRPVEADLARRGRTPRPDRAIPAASGPARQPLLEPPVRHMPTPVPVRVPQPGPR